MILLDFDELLLSGFSVEEALDVMTSQPKPGENDKQYRSHLKGSNSVKTMKAMLGARRHEPVDSPAVKKWRAKRQPDW